MLSLSSTWRDLFFRTPRLAQVVEALKATLPVDPDAFDRAAAESSWWRQYDRDGSGFIEPHELPGLAQYVQAEIARRRSSDGLIPEIRTNRQAWFAYWDEDESGSLDKEEVVRALLKTLRITSEPMRVAQMRSTNHGQLLPYEGGARTSQS